MRVSPNATSTYRLPTTKPFIPCWRMMVSMFAGLIPLQCGPGQVWIRLHVMDRIHFDVLIVLVEFDTAGHAGEVLCRGETIADGLGIRGATPHHVGNQHDLVEGMGVEVRRILVVLVLEGVYEIAHDVALVGGVELDNTNVAQRSFARLLLESKR